MKNLFFFILLLAGLSSFAQTAPELYAKAQTAAEKQAWTYVEVYLDDAIALDGNQAEYYYLRGKSNMAETTDTAKYVKAIHDFNKAIELKTAHKDIYQNLALVKQAFAQECNIRAERGDTSLFKRAIFYALGSISDFESAKKIEDNPKYNAHIADLKKLVSLSN
ncbi:MAG: hypothetical protein IE931_03420 [Sphingobacteriales bacterium]|nr:hypothetical protein [Sphingobacteriales bacterium]